MKCPYCVEEISDAAIVCKHCGRDFSIFRPLLERIQALETDVTTIRAAVTRLEGLSGQSLASATAETTSEPAHVPAVSASIVALTSFGSILCYWLWWRLLSAPIFSYFAVAFPALGGLAAGILFQRRRLKLYCFLGLLIGFIDFAGNMLVWRAMSHSKRWYPSDWLKAFLVIAVGQLVLVVLMGVFADWVKKLIRRAPSKEEAAPRLAVSLARIGSPSGGDMSKSVDFWKMVLSALTPVLTLIGSIITGYFTYLAAVVAKNPK